MIYAQHTLCVYKQQCEARIYKCHQILRQIWYRVNEIKKWQVCVIVNVQVRGHQLAVRQDTWDLG